MNVRHPLLLLTLAVAAAHALLLAGVTAREVRPAASAPQAFATRTVMAPSPQSPAPSADVATKEPAKTSPHLASKAASPAPRADERRARKTVRPREPSKGLSERMAASPPLSEFTALPTPTWQMPGDAEKVALGAVDVSAEQEAQGSERTDTAKEDTVSDSTPPPDMAASPAAGTDMVADTKLGDENIKAGSAGASAAANSSAAPEAPDTGPAAQPASTPVPVKLPPSRELGFTVTGQAKGFGYSALATLRWEHDATSYRAHQEVKVIFLGSRSQTSEGSITEWGLQPRRFGDRARSERAAHFDFAQGRVTFSANTPAAPIAPGAQDRLSVFLQLASLLAAAPERYPNGTAITMTTVSARSADDWTFTVQGNETLDLPIGPLATVQLQRMPRREYDQKAQVWLAPSLGYLPARIRITEANGDFVELNLRSDDAL